MTKPRDPRPPRRRDTLLLLGLIAAIGLATLPEDLYPGDPVAMRVSAAALVKFGDPSLDDAMMARPRLQQLAQGDYFARNPETGRWHSKYGVGATLLYVPPLWLEQIRGRPLALGKLGTSSFRLALGLYQLLFVVLIAAYLLQLAAPVARTRAAPVLFVLATLYGTFAWNYLRAQTSEVFQLAFLLAFVVHTFAWHREGRTRDLWIAQLWLAALVLTKPFHVVLVPVFAAVVWVGNQRSGAMSRPQVLAALRERFGSLALHVGLPMAALGAALLTANELRFGSPFATGYAEGAVSQIFGGSVVEGLSGFLVAPQRSVFTHFPILALSLLGLPAALARFRFETVFGWALLLLYLLLLSSYVFWDGSWGYGPRYLLPVLPIASLPFVAVLDAALERTRRGAALAALLVVVVASSVALQWNVNGLRFLTHLYARQLFTELSSPHVDAFFGARHVGLVHRDLIRWRDDGGTLVPLEVLRSAAEPSVTAEVEGSLRELLRPNYRWHDFAVDRPLAE